MGAAAARGSTSEVESRAVYRLRSHLKGCSGLVLSDMIYNHTWGRKPSSNPPPTFKVLLNASASARGPWELAAAEYLRRYISAAHLSSAAADNRET